jgi:hypothetical protein
MIDVFSDYIGKEDRPHFFIGVVEDNADPMTLLRVKVRCFGIHPENRDDVPTSALPWAITMQPSNSANISGIGDFTALIPGTWVFGIFLDGKLAQYPMVMGTIPGIHRPGAPGLDGSHNGGYTNGLPGGSYGDNPPYHADGASTLEGGNNIRDDGTILTDARKSNWPLKIYNHKKAGQGGLACKGTGTNGVHYSSALALEELTRQVKGGSPFYITSGYRSPSHNARVGGARNSYHMRGRAFDIARSSIPNVLSFLELAAKNGFVGFGKYNSFIHIDTGSGRTWGGFNSAEIAALKRGGWYSGKKGLQGVKVDPQPSEKKEDKKDADLNPTPKPESTPSGLPKFEPTENTTGVGSTSSPESAGETNPGAREPPDPNPIPTSNRTVTGRATAYSPRSGGDKMQGGLESSRKGPDGAALVRTLEDYYNKKSSYVTLAGNPSLYGNKYLIKSITFRLRDGGTHTLNNVLGVVHDTGSAFKTVPEGRFDIPVGINYTDAQIYSQPYSNKILLEYTLLGVDTNVGKGGSNPTVPGFNDPTGQFPKAEYRGKPSTAEEARGLNGGDGGSYPSNPGKSTTGASGFPVAGDTGTFGAPESPYAPQYPFNNVKKTASGHMVELDDTSGAERVHIFHRSGSRIEFSAKGGVVQETMGNDHKFVAGDAYNGIQGDYYLSAIGDMNLRTTTDAVIHSDGSMTIQSNNDGTLAIAGDLDISVGDELQLKANKIKIQANNIDIYAPSNFNVRAGNINMKAEFGFNIEAKTGLHLLSQMETRVTGKSLHLKGNGNVYIDDIIRMAMGLSADALPAEDAKSTDIGDPIKRRAVQKGGSPQTNSNAYTTTEEAAENYQQKDDPVEYDFDSKFDMFK